jgi:hypothetical protein
MGKRGDARFNAVDIAIRDGKACFSGYPSPQPDQVFDGMRR